MSKKAPKKRMIMISTFLTQKNITYLEKKVKKNDPEKRTRGAVLRYLINKAREKDLL